jgi:hypothetical protein
MTKTEKIKQLVEADPKMPIVEIARKAGCSPAYARKIAGTNASRGAPNGNTNRREGKTKKEFNNSSGYMEFYTNEHVKDVDDVTGKMGVNMEKWYVDRFEVVDNAWDVTIKNAFYKAERHTNYQFKIKVWFKPKVKPSVVEALEILAKKIPQIKAPKYTPRPRTGNLLEISVLDAHLGKLAWAMETGRRDYDLALGCKDYYSAVGQSLEWGSMFKPERIIYILGQDLMHIENYEGVTHKGGNNLDADTRYPKIMYKAMRIVFDSIMMCKKLAPVDVIWVPGNHDMHASLAVATAMMMAFKDDSRVTVDISPAVRKARLWGNLLVGFCHMITGRHEAWVNELAHAFPKLWGESVFREWHFGHKHKKREIKMHPIMTQGGVLMRQLTALSPIDAWHFEGLFTDAVPGGESLVWTKDRGVIANFTAWSDAPVMQENGKELT